MKYCIEDPQYTVSRAILEVDYCLLSWYPELTTGSDKVLGSPAGTAGSYNGWLVSRMLDGNLCVAKNFMLMCKLL